MSAGESFPRKRSSRVTRAQVDFLTDYMTRHKTFALGLYSSLQGKDQHKILWADLIANLNSLGSAKSIQKWQKVWSEIKSKARLKYQKVRSERTPGILLNDCFSDLEKKVLSIIGVDLSDENHGPILGDRRTRITLYESKGHVLENDDICSEVIISEETPCEEENLDNFSLDGDGHSIGCSSEENIEPGTPAGDSELSACESMPQKSGQKRLSSADFDGREVHQKRHPSFLHKRIENSEVSKSQNKMLMGLLSSQQEMVQALLNSQQEIMQGLLRSQQKIVQDLQSSQQEIAKSVMNFMNRRADLDERVIRLEEEKLKLEERKLNALAAMHEKNGL